MKRAPMKNKHKSIPSHERAHYMRVAALPCACCGIEGYSQCAHSNLREHGKGLGIKADYLATFPLCCVRTGIVGCHQSHDQLIGMSRDDAEEATHRYIFETHRKLGIA